MVESLDDHSRAFPREANLPSLSFECGGVQDKDKITNLIGA
jgi:hypothetical protein